MKKILVTTIALLLPFTLNACKKCPITEPTPPIHSSQSISDHQEEAINPPPPENWDEWAIWADKLHSTGDGRGHGPDIGTGEWAYALTRQLDVHDENGHGPDIGSDEWRRAVERKLLEK